MPKQKPWKSVNKFMKRKHSHTDQGHPAWVYRKRGRVYKYLSFTHKPEKDKPDQYERLNYNIDPQDDRECYVNKKYSITQKTAFEEPIKKYRIHDKDKDTIKKYSK